MTDGSENVEQRGFKVSDKFLHKDNRPRVLRPRVISL